MRRTLCLTHICKYLASSYGNKIARRQFVTPAFIACKSYSIHLYSTIPQTSPKLKTNPTNKNSNPDGKPPLDQLQKVYNNLQSSLPKLFLQPMDYSLYNVNVVFINNIRNKTTEGIVKYVQQVALLRTVGHLKFAYVRFEILNMGLSEEECRITVRWRIRGISGLRVMLKFWKFKLWKWKEIMDHQENWYDGISYFDVGSDGLIYRHIADKVMVDKERQIDMTLSKAPLAAKLGVLAALLPRPSLHDAIISGAQFYYIQPHLRIETPFPVTYSHYSCEKVHVATFT